MELHCLLCGEKIEVVDRVGRSDTCPGCRRDLHACVQCAFYDEGAYNQCREPQAERVLDKEKANFCDYFRFGSAKQKKTTKEDSLSKLKDLFKK